MKGAKPHSVPLSKRAVEILQSLPRGDGDGYAFPGAYPGRGLSNMAMLELLKGLRPGVTVHGFRSSFRTWCAEQTDLPREVCEQALAHAVGSKVEQSYKRTNLFERRRALMDTWSAYCSKPPAKAGKVLPMRRRAVE